MSNGHNASRRSGRVWAYTGALLGGLVSIAANVGHSFLPPVDNDPRTPPLDENWTPEVGAVVGAVFWPVAVFVAVEILARIAWPAGRRWLALRYCGLLPVALVAAIVSYRHLSGLLAHYGYDTLTATIGPLAVDGLMVMATGALIATGTGLAHVTETLTTESAVTPAPPDPAAQQAPTPEAPKVPATSTPARRATKRDTGKAIAALVAKHPDLTQEQIAKRLNVTDRTVRRHLNNATSTPEPIESVPAPLAAVS